MNEKPILFSSAMVRAILEGRKTQTRRVVKPPAPFTSTDADLDIQCAVGGMKCPYGKPGDHLWVREMGSGSVSNGGPRDLDIHMQAVPGRWGDTGRDGVK